MSHLMFKKHVSLIVRKSYIALKLLYNNLNIINFKLRKKFCETPVLSILNYYNVVYYSYLHKITQIVCKKYKTVAADCLPH